jgi:hypothetical protein
VRFHFVVRGSAQPPAQLRQGVLVAANERLCFLTEQHH